MPRRKEDAFGAGRIGAFGASGAEETLRSIEALLRELRDAVVALRRDASTEWTLTANG